MRTLTASLLGLFIAFNAQAAHRTYVAASGTDAGTCGPTTPCRTLDYAMGQTDSGGEVIITESGGYGSSPSGGITITKSISIIAQPGVFAALAPTTGYNGIDIATPGIKVVIKGLNINSRGGTNGINMTNGTSLLVEKSSIAGNLSGNGLYVQTTAIVNVVDTVIRDYLNGVWAGTGATVIISSSTLLNNASYGVYLATVGTAAGVTTRINLSDTVVSGSSGCIANQEVSGNSGVINATRVTATQCNGFGFYVGSFGSNQMTVSSSTASGNGIGYYADMSGSVLVVSGSSATNNAVGFSRDPSSTFISLGNNTVHGNVTDTIGTITPAALE